MTSPKPPWAALVAERFAAVDEDTEPEVVALIRDARRRMGLPAKTPWRSREQLIADAKAIAEKQRAKLEGDERAFT